MMEECCDSNFTSAWTSLSKDDFSAHQRVIIHLDMDCFYAQVEEVRDPFLRSRPLGVQQKNFVVTCNYKAREFGVHKLMLVSDAKRACPELVLVNGEDLTPYRQMSQKIFDILLNYTPHVEKLGLDENFMDVTALVEEEQSRRIPVDNSTPQNLQNPLIVGHTYPEENSNNDVEDIENSQFVDCFGCNCGCALRLRIGSKIAQDIRDDLLLNLGLTCSAGIAHNKLLAKLIGGQHKPNQQTTLLYPRSAARFLRELNDLKRITGIGQRTESLLLESGIANIGELQDCSLDVLRKRLGHDTANKVRDLVLGRDNSAVRTTGKPKSISLEDSCKPLSVRKDVEERFRLLLLRLMEQVGEDGRIPVCIKVILRKYDPLKKCSHRETKQANILPSFFRTMIPCRGGETAGSCPAIKVMLADGAQDKLLKTIMRLFERVVDLNKPFNITLIGLAFSKFQQRKVGSSSIANFLIKKDDLEVQSVTSLTNFEVKADSTQDGCSANHNNSNKNDSSSSNNDIVFRSSPVTFQSSEQFHRRRTAAASPVPMLVDNGSESAATNSDFSDYSETEIEPSPKKTRLSNLLLSSRNKRSLTASQMASNESLNDIASPSKLRVCDLRLNSRDSDRDFPIAPMTNCSSSSSTISYPTTANDRIVNANMLDVAPPPAASTTNINTDATTGLKSSPASIEDMNSLPHAIDISDISDPPAQNIETLEERNEEGEVRCDSKEGKVEVGSIVCPSNVDMEVFKDLPADVQHELLLGWQRSLATAINNGTNIACPSGDSMMSVDTDSNGNPSKATTNTASRTVKHKNGNLTGTAHNSRRTQKTLFHYFRNT